MKNVDPEVPKVVWSFDEVNPSDKTAVTKYRVVVKRRSFDDQLDYTFEKNTGKDSLGCEQWHMADKVPYQFVRYALELILREAVISPAGLGEVSALGEKIVASANDRAKEIIGLERARASASEGQSEGQTNLPRLT